MKKSKLPADLNKKAFSIVQLATSEVIETPEEKLKTAAALLGRKGGLIGGKARADKLKPKERSAIAKKAAKARWRKD